MEDLDLPKLQQLTINCMTNAAEPETVLEAFRLTPRFPSVFTQQGLLQTALASDVSQIAAQWQMFWQVAGFILICIY